MLVTNSDQNNIYNKYSSIPVTRSFTHRMKTSNRTDVFFKADQNKETTSLNKKYENPINSKMEYLDAARLTAAAGLVLAGRIALEFIDIIDDISFKSLKYFSIACLAIGGIYAVMSLPKNLYNRKVETFQKKKEMDVYVRSNSAEKRLYERLDEEGKEANKERRDELSEDLIKLKTAKNQVPDFIRSYDKKSSDKDDPTRLP